MEESDLKKVAAFIIAFVVVLSASMTTMAQPSETQKKILLKDAEMAMAVGDFDKATAILSKMDDADPIISAYLRFCETWRIDDAERPLETAKVWKEFPEGTVYELREAFVYIPKEVNEGTRYLVYYAGGSGGWELRQNYAIGYCEKFSPNAVCVFMKSSGLADIQYYSAVTGEILRSMAAETGINPYRIVILSSSNGGYMTFYGATYLYNQYGIITDKICSLDMGLNWGKAGALISEEEAQPLVAMQTKVYAFEQHDEIWGYKGAQQFASYGVPLIEVACVNADHERMTKIAFRNGTFSWAIGQIPDLDPFEYRITPVNF